MSRPETVELSEENWSLLLSLHMSDYLKEALLEIKKNIGTSKQRFSPNQVHPVLRERFVDKYQKLDKRYKDKYEKAKGLKNITASFNNLCRSNGLKFRINQYSLLMYSGNYESMSYHLILTK